MARIMSKSKGNRWERDLCDKLTDAYGKPFRRVPNSGSYFGKSNYIRAEGMQESAKQCLSGDIITPEGWEYSIEAKSYREFDFWNILYGESAKLNEWITQAENDSKFSNRKMLLAIKIDRKCMMVCLKLSENYEVIDKFDNYYIYKNAYIIISLEDFLEKIINTIKKVD